MKKMNKIGLMTLMLITALIMSACGGAKEDVVIKIGHKNFTEQRILGQLYAVMIEEKTDYKTDVKEFGGTQLAFEATKSNDIDLYCDYTGTLYSAMLQLSGEKDPKKVYDIVKEGIEKDNPITIMKSLGFNNTYTLSVDKDIAAKYNLEKISDLETVGSELTIGAAMEFLERTDGIKGVKEVYGIEFKDEIGLDPGIRYTAIQNGEVDLIDAFSTDGKIKEYELKVLEDDKNFFPPYYALTMLNSEAEEKYPEVVKAIQLLEGNISDDDMQGMNYEVDQNGLPERKVAEDFLRAKGLIE